jgi:hypothetical protein
MVTEAPSLVLALYSAPPGGQPPSGGQALVLYRPGPLLALLPRSLWLLVWLPLPTEVVAPARAAAAPPRVVRPTYR